MEFFLILFLIPPLVIIQTIVGVGVLVLGTPALLLLNYNIIDAIDLLLPISIFTSFLNVTIFSNYNFKKIEKKKYKYFFIICIPGILIGLKSLEIFQKSINFEILVSLIILISLYLKLLAKGKLIKLSKIKKKIIIFITGVVHGLTNSGGSILALFISTGSNNKNQINFDISLFYFLLASVQYLTFVIIFGSNFQKGFIFELIIVIFASAFVGNKINAKFSNRIFQMLLNLIVFISAISLILKNLST